MISRILEKTIESHLGSKKAIVLIGARQVGKTTLLQHFAQAQSKSVLIFEL
jgi:predicted AAA+ superfamily ATPase